MRIENRRSLSALALLISSPNLFGVSTGMRLYLPFRRLFDATASNNVANFGSGCGTQHGIGQRQSLLTRTDLAFQLCSFNCIECPSESGTRRVPCRNQVASGE